MLNWPHIDNRHCPFRQGGDKKLDVNLGTGWMQLAILWKCLGVKPTVHIFLAKCELWFPTPVGLNSLATEPTSLGVARNCAIIESPSITLFLNRLY
jgi:hypothetical protein